MFPLFTTRCLHVRHDVRDPCGGSGKCGRECCPGNFAEMTTSTPFRDLLHAANLRHGTDGFISTLKEGVLRIFSPLKTWRLRPGLKPRTWVLKASTLLLDHRSRYTVYIHKNKRAGHKTILHLHNFVIKNPTLARITSGSFVAEQLPFAA